MSGFCNSTSQQNMYESLVTVITSRGAVTMGWCFVLDSTLLASSTVLAVLVVRSTPGSACGYAEHSSGMC